MSAVEDHVRHQFQYDPYAAFEEARAFKPPQPEIQYEKVWGPIPDTSQELALDARAHHILYHGAHK